MPRPSRPPSVIDVMETLVKAQLQALQELRQATESPSPPSRRKSLSHIDMTIDVLKEAGAPLHARDIIERVQTKYGVTLARESLVSALLKHTARGHFVKTAPNTFALPPTERQP